MMQSGRKDVLFTNTVGCFKHILAKDGVTGFYKGAMMNNIRAIGSALVLVIYDELKGVISVESGYMGGKNPNPTYEQVCGGNTGHAEVVQITYDPAVVSFVNLLDVFFVIHDPTTLNRQGNDQGTQYRSAIYVADEVQRAEAEATHRAIALAEIADVVQFLANAGGYGKNLRMIARKPA